MLHVSTAPLAGLYRAPATPVEDLQAIEYAWHAAQSVFDTMLATGLLLIPIGIVLFGVAMRSSVLYRGRLSWSGFTHTPDSKTRPSCRHDVPSR